MKFIRTGFCALAVFLLITNINAQTKAPAASVVIKEATSLASKSNKNVFIIFHASWCVWCHRMDSSMNDKTVKDLFDKSYVMRHLTVDESKENKHLENPGADAVRIKYHGDHSGIPFWFILDKKGDLLADSRMVGNDGKVGDNVGCPATPEEVDYFVKVLAKTSDLNPGELLRIQKKFAKNQH